MSKRRQEPGRPARDAKRPYTPPRLEAVKVNLDEVALAACKAVGGGAGGASCAFGCVISGS